MGEDTWFVVGTFIKYFVLFFGGMVGLVFLWFLLKAWLLPTTPTGTSTPDVEGECSDPERATELDPTDDLSVEIGRSATQLAEHKAAQRKEQGNG